MTFLDLLLTAIALSMDALAVSITIGIALREKIKLQKAGKVGLFFGGFQALMPAIGYLLGRGFHELIASLDHWAAFLMLFIVGAKMIWDARKTEGEAEAMENPVAAKTLLPMAVATSIDALAVGISLAMTQASLLLSVAVIGIITLIICTAGVMLGKQLRHYIKHYAAMAGGGVLILIGVKILIEHLVKGI